jgi:tRNA uridine 5-carboxymethylaminomethyl modification enzyme
MLKNKKEKLKKHKNNNNKKIPQDLKYNNIPGLSNEVKEKLIKHKPKTIGHASKIEGITPAAVNLILIQIKKKEILKQHA